MGFERADELQRAEDEQRRQDQPDDPEQRVQQVGLDEGDAGQGRPQAGEQVAQMRTWMRLSKTTRSGMRGRWQPREWASSR
jgi:hypothetical protein